MRRHLAGFASDRGGNFGIIAALLAVPLVLSVGIAIDFSSISSKKAALQNAIDSAVLAIARQGKDVSDDEAAAIAKGFLASNFDQDATSFQVSKVGTRFSV